MGLGIHSAREPTLNSVYNFLDSILSTNKRAQGSGRVVVVGGVAGHFKEDNYIILFLLFLS